MALCVVLPGAALVPAGMGCASLGGLSGGDAGDDAGVADVFLVSPKAIAFGDAGGTPGFIACGSTPAPTATLQLTNISRASIPWWWSLGRGDASPYTLSTVCTSAGPCGLAPGNQTIVVTGPEVPSAPGIVRYDDTLTLFSAASGDAGTKVSLSATSYGAVITASPTTLDFGTQPASAPDGGYTAIVTLKNSGNAPADLELVVTTTTPAATTPPAFQFAGSTDAIMTVFLSPGDESVVTVSFNPGGNATAFKGVIAEVANGNLGSPNCGFGLNVSLAGQGSP